MGSDFKSVYLGEPHKNLRAWYLAVKYYYLTEKYDRWICSGKSYLTGEAVPINQHERGAINKHAKKIMSEILIEAKQMGVKRSELQMALGEASRFTVTGIEKEWFSLNEQIERVENYVTNLPTSNP